MTRREDAVDAALLRRMTDTLAHRGPDGEGFLLRGNVGFGHRRLSIIDLEGGDQPIYNEDERVGIVFNGEIYNYVELMADLKSRGHVFRTHSDTEVILHAYEEFGEACVEKLRGMFAFAIWNGLDGSVFLARDRLGIKPLFYMLTEDRLLFASELKAIVSDEEVAREVNTRVLSEYLTYGYIPGDRCILKGIDKLPQGCTLTWRDGRATVRRYWDVVMAPETVGAVSAAEYEERLDEVLREATRIHLRSDVPVGVLLSGGVDSASMTALASLALDRPVKTFSVGFADGDINELSMAKLSAERYGTEHVEIVVKDHDIGSLPDVAWHLDEPFADPSSLPTYYVCREAAKHVKVCLTGDGADEALAGYARYRDALKYKIADWAPAGVRRAVFGTAATLAPQAMWGKGLLGRLASDGARRYLDSVGVFSVEDARATLSGDVAGDRDVTAFLEPYFGGNGSDIVATLQFADQKTYLPDDILVKADRMSMQNSLETRPPFLDHEVIEFANRCPTKLKLNEQGVGKAILKRVMADRIPREVIDRKKTGFGLPTKQWFRGGMETMARDMLLSPSTRSTGYLDRSAVEGIIDGHQKGMRDLSRKIWSLLIFEHWLRAYRI
jgi:asparagine synthase (glutamine-hydrolysing)